VCTLLQEACAASKDCSSNPSRPRRLSKLRQRSRQGAGRRGGPCSVVPRARWVQWRSCMPPAARTWPIGSKKMRIMSTCSAIHRMAFSTSNGYDISPSTSPGVSIQSTHAKFFCACTAAAAAFAAAVKGPTAHARPTQSM